MIHISPVVGRGDDLIGLPVLDREGRQVGTVSGAEADTLRVNVAADAPREPLRCLEWCANDADCRLPSRYVAERSREAVRLKA